jgi:hypothetical protein
MVLKRRALCDEVSTGGVFPVQAAHVRRHRVLPQQHLLEFALALPLVLLPLPASSGSRVKNPGR